MNEVAFLLQAVLVVAATVIPIVVIVWLIAGRDADGAGDTFGLPADRRWPRGVQEEEPLPWRLGFIPV